jgi:opacity protein-like surface antigen
MNRMKLQGGRAAVGAGVRALAFVFAAGLALTALAPRAEAQPATPIAISGFGGYYVASDLYNDTASNASLSLENSFEYGGRLTFFTNRYSAVEVAYTRVGSDLKIRAPGSSIIPSDYNAGRVNGDQWDLNFLVSQPVSNPNVWPYFTIGLGWTMTHPDIQNVSVDGNSLFAFNFGLGTMIEMNEKLSLRLDARWRTTDTNITTSSGVYCDYWGYCWSYASDWYNSGDLTAGLTYHFAR